MGAPQGPTTPLEKAPGSVDLARWFDEFLVVRKDSGSITWWFVFLQSWAPRRWTSMRDTCGTSSSDGPSVMVNRPQ